MQLRIYPTSDIWKLIHSSVQISIGNRMNASAITKRAKSKNRMQIIGTLRESHFSVFWKK